MSTTAAAPASRVRPAGPPRPPGRRLRCGDGGGGRRARRPRPRPVVIALLAVVVLIVAYLVLSSSSAQTYHLLFTDAGQLVKGNQVQVGGVPVGRSPASR